MGNLTDFFFTGAGVLGAMFLAAGLPLEAAAATLLLCIAGGVCSIGDPDAPHSRAARKRRDRDARL